MKFLIHKNTTWALTRTKQSIYAQSIYAQRLKAKNVSYSYNTLFCWGIALKFLIIVYTNYTKIVFIIQFVLETKNIVKLSGKCYKKMETIEFKCAIPLQYFAIPK